MWHLSLLGKVGSLLGKVGLVGSVVVRHSLVMLIPDGASSVVVYLDDL